MLDSQQQAKDFAADLLGVETHLHGYVAQYEARLLKPQKPDVVVPRTTCMQRQALTSVCTVLPHPAASCPAGSKGAGGVLAHDSTQDPVLGPVR